MPNSDYTTEIATPARTGMIMCDPCKSIEAQCSGEYAHAAMFPSCMQLSLNVVVQPTQLSLWQFHAASTSLDVQLQPNSQPPTSDRNDRAWQPSPDARLQDP